MRDRHNKLLTDTGGDPVPLLVHHLATRPADLAPFHAALCMKFNIPAPPSTSSASDSSSPSFAPSVLVPILSVPAAAALKTELGLSRDEYTALSMLLKGVLPPHHRLADSIEAAAAPVSEVVVEGLSMAVTSLRSALEADLRANSLLRAQSVHSLKIGGDASYDASEKEEKSSSILLLLFAWMAPAAGLPANSTRSHRILAASWAKESHASVQTMCRYFAAEITQLRDEGLTLTIDETTYTFRFNFYVSGDMKWVRMAYGLGGCSSKYGCLYCRIEKKDIHRYIRDGEFQKGYDTPREEMRSIDLMRRQAANAAETRKKKAEKAAVKKQKQESKEEKKTTKKKQKGDCGKENVVNEKKVEKDGKAEKKKEEAQQKKLNTVGSIQNVENQEYPPAWDIEPSASPPERLHMLLCICRIFERTLALMLHPKETCIPRGKKRTANPTMELRNNDEHRDSCLRPLRIDRRPITGYTGEEWKRILTNPALWCSLAPGRRNHANLVKSMQQFAELYEKMSTMRDEKSAMEFGQAALTWAKELVLWCEGARESFYLHVLAHHAWRWHGLGDYASYGMEKVNSMMKKKKRRYSFDKKSADSARSARGCLTSMVRETNARNVLAPLSPLLDTKQKKYATWQCSGCSQTGHKRNSPACPKRPRLSSARALHSSSSSSAAAAAAAVAVVVASRRYKSTRLRTLFINRCFNQYKESIRPLAPNNSLSG